MSEPCRRSPSVFGSPRPAILAAALLGALAAPAAAGVEVRLAQSDAAVVKQWGDQFDRHPNQGFVHPGSRLGCKAVISHGFGKPTPVVVRHGFEKGQVAETRITLNPGRPNEEVTFVVGVDADDLSDARPRLYELNIEPADAGAGKDARLFHGSFPFRMTRVDEIVSVEKVEFDGKVAGVIVQHLATDPVCGPLDVAVTIDGRTPGRSRLRPGADHHSWITTDAPPAGGIPVSVSVANRPNAIRTRIPVAPGAVKK